MLEQIKLLLGITDASKDELLMTLIDSAINEFKTYTHNNSTAEHENVICSMVVYNYNRIGSEGVSSEDYSGVKYTYASDYPESILRQLRAIRRVVIIA